MQLLTNLEYNHKQYCICKLRADYANVYMMLVDRTEYGSTSFWIRVHEYWLRKAAYWKSLGIRGYLQREYEEA
ncbi:hypothetical protein [Fibrobacter sp.]|uniref:hypothetical protein n=1 Tax=Fibrobacter sp. TaxID=35828 RepID=UPI0025C30A0C|nr:hypothetical protein [Fibrobacter sp.]MBR3073604.1 hypothetical protein [Fibrobacter sp.]